MRLAGLPGLAEPEETEAVPFLLGDMLNHSDNNTTAVGRFWENLPSSDMAARQKLGAILKCTNILLNFIREKLCGKVSVGEERKSFLGEAEANGWIVADMNEG